MPRPTHEELLDRIFALDDPHGIFEVKPTPTVRTEDQRVVDQFGEISAFVDRTGAEPGPESSDFEEQKLAVRLGALRESDHTETLGPHDRHGLLAAQASSEPTTFGSIDEVLASEDLDFLNEDDLGLHDLRHVPKETTMPDYIAGRTKCENFERFRPLFTICKQDLRAGKRKLTKFKNEQQIDVGYFFVLNGILTYVAEVGDREPDANGKTNARLRCIFDNERESDMLLRSLAAGLYKDGKRITEHEDRQLANFEPITEDDRSSGYLYVLSSLSEVAEISSIADLYKIGFSRSPVETRIKHAEREPTYLMAPVNVEGVWQCYNMNPQKLEGSLHQFFGSACLNVQIAGPDGRYTTPREWFIAPLPIIEQTIDLIISGEIVKYRYAQDLQAIATR